MAGIPLGSAFGRVDRIAAAAIERSDELTDFEAGFVSGLAERLGRYAERTLMTGKQREVIDRLATKLALEAVEW